MKILKLTLALSLTMASVFAQTEKTNGQYDNFYKHVGSTTKYLPEAASNNIEGTSIVSFKVKAGSVSDLTVRKSVGNGLDGEVVARVLDFKQFEQFKDGSYLFPVTFTLTGTESVKKEDLTLKGFTKLNPVIVVGYRKQAENKSSIKLRGTFNLDDIKQPLVYLDSTLIAYGDIETIDQNSIERIDVLKDADAIAKYGPRALNGVVLITTKVAKEKSKN